MEVSSLSKGLPIRRVRVLQHDEEGVSLLAARVDHLVLERIVEDDRAAAVGRARLGRQAVIVHPAVARAEPHAARARDRELQSA